MAKKELTDADKAGYEEKSHGYGLYIKYKDDRSLVGQNLYLKRGNKNRKKIPLPGGGVRGGFKSKRYQK